MAPTECNKLTIPLPSKRHKQTLAFSVAARRNRPASALPPLIFARTILKSH